jgi:hypothetical protein
VQHFQGGDVNDEGVVGGSSCKLTDALISFDDPSVR